MSFPAFKLAEHKDVATVALSGKLAVPEALKPILTKDTTTLAAELLMSLLDVVAADKIDKETTYDKVNPGKTQNVKNELKVSSWGSGGGLGTFSGKLYRFKEVALTTYFGKLFDAVKAAVPNAKYSRNNFFHGHSVFDKVDGSVDSRIVFHAYEYPENLETTKSGQANEVEPSVAEFKDDKSDFYKRNVIWSMRSNTLLVPDYWDYLIVGEELSDFPYGGVVTPEGCVMNQAKIGEEIIAFNFFPSEGVKLFLKQ